MLTKRLAGCARRTAAAGGAIGTLAIGAAVASAATTTLDYYGLQTTSTVTTAAGKPANPNALPAIGDVLVNANRLYTGTAKHHAAKPSGSVSLKCTVKTASTALCTAVFTLGHSTLHTGNFSFNFAVNPIKAPITGGSGAYAHAHGKLTATNVNSSGSKTNFVLSFAT